MKRRVSRVNMRVYQLTKAAPAIRAAIRRHEQSCWGEYLELVTLRFRSNLPTSPTLNGFPELRAAVDSLIRYAVRRDALECLQVLDARGCSFVHVTQPMRGTLLHEAARSGSLRTLCWLIDAQALPVGAQAARNVTPLHLASKHGHVEIVRALLARQSFVDTPDMYGGTPLHEALFAGHHEIARFLIDAAANLGATALPGETPLMTATRTAIRTSQWTTVELLLNRGAALGHALPLLLDPQSSVISPHPRVQAASLESSDQHEVGRLFETATAEQARALLERGAHPETAAIYALRNEAHALLGVIRARRPFLYTSAHYHAALESVQGLQQLLNHGGDPNAIIEAKNVDERFPLIYFAAQLRMAPETIPLLLRHGARPAAPPELTAEPLLVNLSREYYLTPEMTAAYVECGHDVNVRAGNGKTALHFLVVKFWSEGLANNIDALLRAGAEVNATDRNGRTPLMDFLRAYEGDDVSCITALLEAGASVTAIDRRGWTVLHYLYEKQSNIDPETDYHSALHLLLSRGADIHALCDEGFYADEVGNKSNLSDPRKSLKRLRERVTLSNMTAPVQQPLRPRRRFKPAGP